MIKVQSEPDRTGVESIKPMATIYAATLVALVILLAIGNIFAGGSIDQRTRAAMLVFVGSMLLMILGAEIARVLRRTGMTPVGFVGFLLTNLLLGGLILAVFADLVGLEGRLEVAPLIGIYLISGIIWYAIVILWCIVKAITGRRKSKTE